MFGVMLRSKLVTRLISRKKRKKKFKDRRSYYEQAQQGLIMDCFVLVYFKSFATSPNAVLGRPSFRI